VWNPQHITTLLAPIAYYSAKLYFLHLYIASKGFQIKVGNVLSLVLWYVPHLFNPVMGLETYEVELFPERVSRVCFAV
jgi:hypothetical protein